MANHNNQFMNTRLKKNLCNSLEIYNTGDIHKIGKLNDKLLAELVMRIRLKPSLNNFILFVNCLNFFYSTRLQASKGNKNDIIIKVARILKENWSSGLRLKEEQQGSRLNVEKVDVLRNAIFNTLKRNAYSFSTKVFHQLNYGYPILDNNVNIFLKRESYGCRVNFYNNDYAEFKRCFYDLVNDIRWPVNSINKLDRAIWGIVSRNEKKYFPSRYNKNKEKIGTSVAL
jgi:hypothetical protein